MLKYITNKVQAFIPESFRRPASPKQLCDAVEKKSTRLCDAVKEKSTRLGPPEDPMAVYAIPLQTKQISVDGCKHFSYGRKSNKSNCTIMVLGATGAGKSTLINGMINYILGVEWEDSFRFKLVDEGQLKSQAHSQTSEVTVYKLYHQEGFQIDYSLTIVDTPGFGDTRGIERDRMIVEQLRNLFSADLGVSEIHAVCFVAQASLARLTPSQRYVFDSVLSIFGKDVAENIRILVTFADGQRPPVLEAIKASGVPCPKTDNGLPVHFKFNNSALFAYNKPSERDGRSEDDEDGTFDKMFWNMGTKSMKRFFVALNRIEPKSLTLTKEVLKERQRLENSVEKLQEQVKLGLAKLEEIKETSEILKEHEAEISRNKDFEFEVTVKKPVQVDISGTGLYITNCQQCHFTCHEICGIANDAEKYSCCAMGSDGYCRECPGKCYWNIHFNQKYKWGYIEEKEKRTVKELQEKYLKATEGESIVQALVDKLEAEYGHVQAKVVDLMETSAKCLNRLKEIALKPNPLSTPEYIDMLIEGEKSEAKPGWNQRVKALTAMKVKAEYMAKVEKGEKLLRRQESQQGVSKPAKTGPGENPEKAQETEAMTVGPQGEMAGPQDETAGPQGETAGPQGETAGAQDETAGSQGETAGAQGETAGAQDETARAQDGTAGAQDETAGAQDETARAQDGTAGAQDETAGLQDETAGAQAVAAGPQATTAEPPAEAAVPAFDDLTTGAADHC